MQSPTVVPASDPEFAALLHAVFWTEHDRWRAAPWLTKVSPLTENGRAPLPCTTGGAAPPSAPVKVCTFAGKLLAIVGYLCMDEHILPVEVVLLAVELLADAFFEAVARR